VFWSPPDARRTGQCMHRSVSTHRIRRVGRGPGCWQRRILERLATGNPFYLTQLLPDRMEPRHGRYPATYQALWRACVTLYGQRRLDAYIYQSGTPSRILVVPVGLTLPDERPPDLRAALLPRRRSARIP